MDQCESSIQIALAKYNDGIFSSIRATVRVHNISERSLHRRLADVQNRRAAHVHEKLLLPQLDEFLIQCILEQEAYRFSPSYTCAREMATRILRMNGNNQLLGKKLITEFIPENLRIVSIIGRSIYTGRVNGAYPKAIQEFCDMYQDAV